MLNGLQRIGWCHPRWSYPIGRDSAVIPPSSNYANLSQGPRVLTDIARCAGWPLQSGRTQGHMPGAWLGLGWPEPDQPKAD